MMGGFENFFNFVKRNKEILLMVFLYVIVFSTISCLKHATFQTQAYDLGIFEQTFWNSFHGRFMYNTIERANHFAIHMSPLMILMLPLYFLFQNPYFLLVFQSIMLGIGAIPLYFLAKKSINKRAALIFAIGYLLYPSLHYVNLYDFHVVSLAVPLLLFSLYLIEIRRDVLASVFLFLSAMSKENIVLAVSFIGIYVFFVKKRRLFGTSIFLLSVLWFLFSVMVIMPWLGGGLVRMDRYSNLGEDFCSIVKSLANPFVLFRTIFQKQKLVYLLKIFFPVSFLPLLYLPGLVLLIPGLAQNLLTNYYPQYSGHYQYDSILIPFVFVLAVFGFREIVKRKREFTNFFLAFALVMFILSFMFFSPISFFNFKDNFVANSNAKTLRQVVSLIPEGASVTADTYLLPHLAHRKEIYMLGHERVLADYVVVDLNLAFPFPFIESKVQYLSRYSEDYELHFFDKGFIIFRKKDQSLQSNTKTALSS